MKKLMLTAVTLVGLSISSLTMATCQPSIALTNNYNKIVYFSTAADPDYMPQVGVGENKTLRSHFLTACNLSTKQCNIFIKPINDNDSRDQTNIIVRLGASITYIHPGNTLGRDYTIDNTARVTTCD